MDAQTAVALVRFGLGRRGSEPLPTDPLAWLAGQLDRPDPALAAPGARAADGLVALRQDREDERARMMPHRVRELVRAEAALAAATLLETASPFRERLVWFWANHFTVSRRRHPVAAVAFAYLREAIRPHVTGRFADLLLAVARHPAMLLYLDNAASVGPGSEIGLLRNLGLNENFARECLELHTIGRDGGYGQADVTAFAALLTGWTIDRAAATPGYAFFPERHQPGPKTVMGHAFPPGEAGGVAALRWLGTHPATYRRIAAALARHFIADAPPADAVRQVAGVLHDTGGDLKAAALALLRLPAAWEPLTKLRSPFDYAVAALRGLDLPPGERPELAHVLQDLGQPWLAAPLPNGWPDTAADWGDGDLLLRRADWAMAVSGRAPAAQPAALAEATLGPFLGETTASAVRRAGSRREALALLLAGPEFQRR
jgi:uncharacterized protein (DUF1800 family)